MIDKDKLRIVFMGSDELSCTYLTALVHAPDMDVVGVVTQPDKAKGRHLKVSANVVKDLALMHCKPVFTPIKINAPESLEAIKALEPDAIVVMAYGQFLGQTLLNMPRLGCINMHVSLLPKLRGAMPIQHAILHDMKETGVTAMMMDRGMDTGDVLGTLRRDISPVDTYGTLSLELCKEGAELMLSVLRKLRDGTCERVVQNHDEATYASKLQKHEYLIEWTNTAEVIERRVRAFYPKTYCYTFMPSPAGVNSDEPGPLIKVLKVAIEDISGRTFDFEPLPGTILTLKKGPLIATGDPTKAIRMLELIPEGRPRPMSGADFANGCRNKMPVGSRLFLGMGEFMPM